MQIRSHDFQNLTQFIANKRYLFWVSKYRGGLSKFPNENPGNIIWGSVICQTRDTNLELCYPKAIY